MESVEALSERENEILRLMVEGLSNREIGLRLSLAFETVKWHNKRILGKLGVSNRTQATLRLKAMGTLDHAEGFAPTGLASSLSSDNLLAPITS